MKRILRFALIAIMVAPLSASAQSEERPYIMQNSTCEQKVTPDKLYMSITINEKDNKGKQSLEELQNTMIEVLTKHKIDVKEALTLNFMGSNISYTKFWKTATPRTSATYNLTLNDAATMQSIVNHLESEGISNIQLTRTEYSKADEIYNELGATAMKKAQAQAKNLAEAIGQNIGPAMTISSYKSTSGTTQPRMYKARAMNDAVVESATIAEENYIEVGKITFSVTVNVKFQLN